MNDRVGPVVDEDEIAHAIAGAFREAARYRERSDDRIVQIAKRARGLAAELNDRVFAAALRSTLEGLGTSWEAKCEVMVLAEQFAYLAGANGFSSKTHSLLTELRHRAHDSEEAGHDSVPDREYATFRGYLLALARTVGMSITVQDMEREVLLREQEPTLWLDLATECFAPGAYIDGVRELLEDDAFSPFEIVRRLPMIVRHQGVSTAQKVLDAACRHLHGQRKYDDAWDLIRRAEDFEPRGWRLPPSGGPIHVPGAPTVEDYIEALLFGPLEPSDADVIRTVERFRSHMDSHLAPISDDEKGRDYTEEEQITTQVSEFISIRKLKITG